LEVSSPGVERPVRWPEHWNRYRGQDVNVKIAGKGRVRATIVQVTDDGSTVVLRPVGTGNEIAVSLKDARDATLVFDWK
jgi:ribosome maturation factor RimP